MSFRIPIEISPVPPGANPNSNPSPAESEQIRLHRIQFYNMAMEIKKKEALDKKSRLTDFPDIDFKFPEAADAVTVKKIINGYFDALSPQRCNVLLGDKVLSRKRYNYTLDVVLHCGEGCPGRDGLSASELRTYLRKNSPFTTKVDNILRGSTGKYYARVVEGKYVLYKTPRPSKKYGTTEDILRVIAGKFFFHVILLFPS